MDDDYYYTKLIRTRFDIERGEEDESEWFAERAFT